MNFIKVKKKPVEVEAFQLTWEMQRYAEDNICEVDGRCVYAWNDGFKCQTLEGPMFCKIGDWIIKGVNNEIYPCREDIFKKTYEVLE